MIEKILARARVEKITHTRDAARVRVGVMVRVRVGIGVMS